MFELNGSGFDAIPGSPKGLELVHDAFNLPPELFKEVSDVAGG